MTQQMPPEQPGQMPVPPQTPEQYAQAPLPSQGAGAPEKKKSWFARHKVLTGLGGAIVLIVIISIAAGGGGNGSDDADAAKSDTSTTTAETKAEAKDPATSETAKEAPKPAEESKPGIGTPVTSGGLEFTVVGIEEVGAQVGGEYLNQTAQGRYVRVNVSVSNVGDKAAYFSTNDLKIIDQQGRSFNADTTATLYDQPNSDTWLSEINPGNKVEGGVVFDLPADVVATTLKVSGGVFSGSEEISLVG